MKMLDRIKGKAAIQAAAEQFGLTPEQMYREIRACIEEAWSSNDPAVRARQNVLFPNGKPTPEQFISTLAKQIKQRTER